MKRSCWILSIEGILVLLCVTVGALVWCGLACAAGVEDAAKTISGMGATEIIATLALAETAALVAVVRLYIKREDRFMDRLDKLHSDGEEISKRLDSRPCFYREREK